MTLSKLLAGYSADFNAWKNCQSDPVATLRAQGLTQQNVEQAVEADSMGAIFPSDPAAP